MNRYIRQMTLIALLFSFGFASAQESLPYQRIAVPQFGMQGEVSQDGDFLLLYANAVLLNMDYTPDLGALLLYETVNGELLGTFNGIQRDYTASAAFSPDGKKLATYHTNGDLIVWDVETQSADLFLTWLPVSGGAVDFTPDGENLVIHYGVMQYAHQAIFNLASQSITHIYVERPSTRQEIADMTSDFRAMGAYIGAAQAVGDSIYGAVMNGEVYFWDDAGIRVSLYPPMAEREMNMDVRSLQVTSAGLAFYHEGAKQTIIIGDDGEQKALDYGSAQFAVSDTGLLAYYDRSESHIYIADLNAPDVAPEPVPFATEAGDRIYPYPSTQINFTSAGDLLITGVAAEDGDTPEGAIYIIDLP